MGIEQHPQAVMDAQVLDSAIVYITSSATVTTKTLKAYERVVRVTTNASNAITVTLPPVAEAVGKTYSIALVVDGGVNLTVASGGDSKNTISSTYADADDREVYFSDGLYWHVLASSGI